MEVGNDSLCKQTSRGGDRQTDGGTDRHSPEATMGGWVDNPGMDSNWGMGNRQTPENIPAAPRRARRRHRQTHKDTQTLGRQESRPDSYLEESESRVQDRGDPPAQDRASNHHQQSPGKPEQWRKKEDAARRLRLPSLGSDPIENGRSGEGRPGGKDYTSQQAPRRQTLPLTGALAAGADGSCSPSEGTGQSNGAP